MKGLCLGGRWGRSRSAPLFPWPRAEQLPPAQGEACSLTRGSRGGCDGLRSPDSSTLQGLGPQRVALDLCARSVIVPLPVSFTSHWPFLQEGLPCQISSGHGGGQEHVAQNLVCLGV